MRWIIVFLIIVLSTRTAPGQVNGQNSNNESNIILPRFLGNETFMNGELNVETFKVYLSKILEYPQEFSKCLFQGTEVIEFTITAKGEPTAFNVVNSVCPVMDAEVIRAIKSTRGRWMPGTVDGIRTDMKQEIAVVFSVCSNKEYMKKVQKIASKGNKLMFALNKPEKALKYYNCALSLMPNDESLLVERSLCRYATGDISGAEKDWNRLKILKKKNNNIASMELIAQQAKNLAGYEEMMQNLSSE